MFFCCRASSLPLLPAALRCCARRVDSEGFLILWVRFMSCCGLLPWRVCSAACLVASLPCVLRAFSWRPTRRRMPSRHDCMARLNCWLSRRGLSLASRWFFTWLARCAAVRRTSQRYARCGCLPHLRLRLAKTRRSAGLTRRSKTPLPPHLPAAAFALLRYSCAAAFSSPLYGVGRQNGHLFLWRVLLALPLCTTGMATALHVRCRNILFGAHRCYYLLRVACAAFDLS